MTIIDTPVPNGPLGTLPAVVEAVAVDATLGDCTGVWRGADVAAHPFAGASGVREAGTARVASDDEGVRTTDSALNKAYGAEQDPALAQKTQTFLDGLPAQVAKGTESITDLGRKLKAKNELAASLINDFAAKNLAVAQ